MFCLSVPARMSDWLLFNTNSAIFQLSWQDQVNFQWDDRCQLSLIFTVLAHWKNSPHIDMSFHSDTLSWFFVLREKQQIPILHYAWPDWGSNTLSTQIEAIMLTISHWCSCFCSNEWINDRKLNLQKIISQPLWGRLRYK